MAALRSPAAAIGRTPRSRVSAPPPPWPLRNLYHYAARGIPGLGSRRPSRQFFGLFEIPQLVPIDERMSQWAIAVHLIGQYVVYLLVAFHVTGVIYHAAIRRDEVLDRMLPRCGARFGA